MQSYQPIPNTTVAPPWKKIKELSYGAKLSLLIVCAFLLIILLVSLFVVIGVLGELSGGRATPPDVPSSLIFLGVAFVLLVGSVIGLSKLWPLTRTVTRFTPSYGVIAPTTSAHPFEVRFHRYLWGRSMRGGGVVEFHPDGLNFSGYLEPSGFFQIGIVLLLTFLPIYFFGTGLGLIPALVIAYYVGRKKITLTIAYSELRDLQVKGCYLSFRYAGVPKQVTFAVAHVDGERLYRELLPRFPAALGGWIG